tara:strand:- start:118 stop:477 length:360 start_codon:yes stop_codon:yes gene_type:complete
MGISKASVSRFALERLRLRIKVVSYSARLNRRAIRVSVNKGFFQKEHFFASEEARYLHLAYGFLTGISYLRLERETRRPPNFDRVRQLIVEYEDSAGMGIFLGYKLKPEWEEAFQNWLR